MAKKARKKGTAAEKVGGEPGGTNWLVLVVAIVAAFGAGQLMSG